MSKRFNPFTGKFHLQHSFHRVYYMDGNESKKIIFSGKQAQDAFRPKEKRVRVRAVDTEPSYYEQLALVTNGDVSLSSVIDTKVNGYKQQDIRRSLLNKETLVTRKEVLSKLKQCELRCHYCKCEVKVLFRTVRDPKQWTLDRVDNDSGHSSANTVIACLSCNLKRRRLDKEVFENTRNIVVRKEIREENIENVQDDSNGID